MAACSRAWSEAICSRRSITSSSVSSGWPAGAQGAQLVLGSSSCLGSLTDPSPTPAVAVLALAYRVDFGLGLPTWASGPPVRWPRPAGRPRHRCSAVTSRRSVAARADAGAVRQPGQLPVDRASSATAAVRHQLSSTALMSPSISIFHGSVATVTPSPEFFAEAGAQQAGSLPAPGYFAGPVRDVDQADVTGSAMFVGGVVAQIGGHIRLHSGGPGRRQQRITGSATDRDAGTVASGSPAARTPSWSAAGNSPGRRSRRTGAAGRRTRPARCPDPSGSGAGRTRRKPAPRRDAQPASPPADRPDDGLGTITSTRSSANPLHRAGVPTAGSAPAPGRNWPSPTTLQLQCE